VTTGETGSGQEGWAQESGGEQPASAAPPPSPPERGGRNWVLIVGLGLVALLLVGGMLLVGAAVVALTVGADRPFGSLGERVAVVTVSGVISTSGEETFFGGPIGGTRAVMEQLRDAADDDHIKAVVLRINSPGGSAAASQEIHDEVSRLAEEKPVVVSMADVAASGGYYIAVPAKRIVANPSTLTGSIGVRMEYLQYHEAMSKLGITGGSLTTGPYKDTGSPWREMREDEERLLQEMLDEIYRQFIEDVAAGRDMDVSEVKEVADGRIFTGEQAMKAGLVDELGNFYRAVEIAGELGGIEGEPKLKYMGGATHIFDWMSTMPERAGRAAAERLLEDYRLEDVDRIMRLPE